ncbi:MAG: hypothetical protein EOO14_15150 [Chitinophagaceae bacterium]|nr:MAG: hypothetical protein EOO14_15150 [Chitinophagaceae bacterium]
MKKCMLPLLLVALSFTALGQQTAPYPQQRGTDLLRKSETQQKWAGALLLTGLGLCLSSVMVPEGETEYFLFGTITSHKNDGLKNGLLMGGVALIGSTIPLFIFANRNLKKARAISGSLHLEKAAITTAGTLGRQHYPAFNIRVAF